MTLHSLKKYILFIVFIIVRTISAYACDVPVYRFALERWPADNFEVIVFNRGELTTEERSAIEMLYTNSFRSNSYSNYTLTTVNLETEHSGEHAELFESLDTTQLPLMVLRYPASSGIRKSIWHGVLTESNARNLIDSPVRKEIAENIIGGSSGVWMLLESGNPAKDNAAAELLEAQLGKMNETLRLPELKFETLFTSYEKSRFSDIDISFPLIRLSRSNSAEIHLISMLVNSEPDLFEYESSPIAFPVYGRGRALYPLIGEGITESNIQYSCAFLTGACSCEVKAINPGFDLLMNVDWESGIGESWIEEMELPQFVGLSELIAGSGERASEVQSTEKVSVEQQNISEVMPAAQTNYPQDNSDDKSDNESSSKIFGNTMIMLGVIIIFITFMGALKISRKTRK